MPAPEGSDTADTEVTPNAQNADARLAPRDAVKPKSQVPVRWEGLARSVLSADCQRILQVLADRLRLRQGPLTCQEMAAAFGMEVVPARLEALRSKVKRLVARGWLAKPVPGRFTLARGMAGEAAGHQQGHRPADHRFGAGGAAFEVACRTAGARQVGEEALHDPHDEPRSLDRAAPGRLRGHRCPRR